MSQLLTYALPGFPLGCIYALVAVGVVLTYKTSGVFNLGFGAQAYVSAAVYYATVEEHGWPKVPAFLVAVVVVGPLLGFVLDRILFRHMRTASVAVKLISALGLLVAIPSIVQFFFGNDLKLRPPSVSPNPHHVYRWGQYHLNGDQLAAVVVTLAAVAGLALLFRFTAVGLRMRAVVESPRMVELSGIHADRVGSFAWMLSSFLAGLAGVLLAPLYAQVDALNFTALLVAAIAAAAFGRLVSLPLTLVGGVILGVGQQVLAGYLPSNTPTWRLLGNGLRPSFPFLMLLALLLFLPGLRTRREAVDPLAVCDPPPPSLAATYRDERLERLNRVLFPGFLVAFFVVTSFFLSTYWLFLVTTGIVLSTVFLSITVLTGMSGQVSLCQGTFAGVGAFTAGQLAKHYGMGFLPAMLVGAVLAAAVGVVVAIPALRLGGLYLALATLAFALMADNVVFPLRGVGGGQEGLEVPRPRVGSIDFAANRAFFLLAMGVFAVCAFVVILVRKGTTGRYLAALRGSELAAATIGINPIRAKITVFALSAAIAGVGGAMFASLNQTTSPADFSYYISLVWVVLVLTVGSRTVEGAVNAGMAIVLVPELLSHLSARLVVLQFALFGYGAITYAKHPEGAVEASKRASIEWITRRRRARRPGEPAPPLPPDVDVPELAGADVPGA